MPTKKRYDAIPLLQKTRDVAGKVPRMFITDSLDQYHIAFKRVFFTLKGLKSIHIRDIHIRNLICNTNKQERFNGGLADHFKYAHGINKESPIFRMTILHHNYIKLHGGIMYRTPAMAAGMDIRGSNIWLTLIQNTVAAA